VTLAGFQRRLITTLLDIDELRGFALAGGWALNAHQILERPTRDIDLFTPDPDLVPTAAASAEQVIHATGMRVDRLRETPTFVSLLVTDTDTGLATTVELAHDARIRPPARLELGPVVAVDELAADKMLALWGRAEARDLLDVDALLHVVTLPKMLDLAAEKDLGFDPGRLPDAITAAVNRPDSSFSALGLSSDETEALRRRARTWLTKP
jgi:hypothetical protein